GPCELTSHGPQVILVQSPGETSTPNDLTVPREGRLAWRGSAFFVMGRTSGRSPSALEPAKMPTTLNAVTESYLRANTLSRGTRNESRSTLRKWEAWGAGAPIEELQRKSIREFLDWVNERAIAQEGTNPGRTANKAREHLRAVLSWAWEQELIDTMPRF